MGASNERSLARTLRWRLSPFCRLTWRQLDDEWLVHDAGAGRTHLLDRASAAVLTHIEDGPISSSDLSAWFAGVLDMSPGPALEGALRQVLEGLVAVELLEAESQ